MHQRAAPLRGSAGSMTTMDAVRWRSTVAIASTSSRRWRSPSGSRSEAAKASERRSSSAHSRLPDGRQRRPADAAVAGARRDGDQPVVVERPQEAAEVAGVEAEPRPQVAHVGAVAADLPEQPRLADRPLAAQEVAVEGADPLDGECG